MRGLTFLLVLLAAVPDAAHGQFIDPFADRVRTPLQVDLERIGTITPRRTDESHALVARWERKRWTGTWRSGTTTAPTCRRPA